MEVKLWERGKSLGHFSAAEVTEMCKDINGPVVAVIDEQGGCAIFQPIDPNTGSDWASEADAIAFGYRYLGLNPDGTPLPVVEEPQPEE
jgi:hypothetical protein